MARGGLTNYYTPRDFRRYVTGYGRPGVDQDDLGDELGPTSTWTKPPGTSVTGGGPNEALPPAPGASGSGSGMPDWFGSGGGGGGGFFGSSSSGAGGPDFSFDDAGLQSMLTGKLKGLVEGNETRWTPGVMDAAKSALRGAGEGQFNAAKESIYNDSARRGMFRADRTGTRVDTARRATMDSYGQGVRGLQIQKAKDDFEDKLAGLDRAQKTLDSWRDFALRSDMNNIQRRQAQASIALGYAQIESARSNLQAQLRAQWDLTNLNREPIEGRDFIYMDDGQGGRVRVPLAALAYMNQFSGGPAPRS